MEIEQDVNAPADGQQQTETTPATAQQQTLTGRLCIYLFSGLLYLKLFDSSSPLLQESRTTSTSSSFSMEIEQALVAPADGQQQTLTGRLCRYLFTVIFYLQLILISGLVIFLALRGLIFTKSPNFHPKIWYTPLLSSVAVSGVLSLLWQCFFVFNIGATVKATLVVAPLLTITVGILVVVYGSTVVRAVGGLIVLFSLAPAFYVLFHVSRERREFTCRMMEIATDVLPARTRPIVVVSAIISVFYSGFLVAGIGGATATRTRLDILFIVISLAWTMQVLKNVQVVAISKASYVYFARFEFMNACDALCATLKNQLGSVCIGSTLVPIVGLIRGMIRSLNICCDDGSDRTMYASNGYGAWIANHLILCGNRYGFVHVGVHNRTFVRASRDAWQEFRTVGLEELIDSDITSSICFFSATTIGAISALTAGIWVFLIHKDYCFELTLYAYIIGYFLGRVSSAWLQGCVVGCYVAYSDDPQSDNFVNTIPKRIERLNIEELNRLAFYARREPEEEENTTTDI